MSANAKKKEAPPLSRGDRNENPPGIGFFALLREDLRTHEGNLFDQGFWAVAVHRFGNWRMGLRKFFRVPLTVLYRMMHKWVEWTCGITLPYTVKLGRRVRIWTLDSGLRTQDSVLSTQDSGLRTQDSGLR